MASKSYVVTSALATPYREDGTRAYLYQGTEWPEGGLREGETDRFLDLGFIAETTADEQADDKPTARKSSK